MHKILIKDLIVDFLIGVYPEERKNRQNLIINLEIRADLSQACKTDNVNHTLDYEKIERMLINLSNESEFCLIETIANKIGCLILEENLVKSVLVRIDKPKAIKSATSAGIEIKMEEIN